MSTQQTMFDQTLSPEDFPARTFRWLDDVLDSLESGAVYGGNSIGSFATFFPPGFLSKTSLAFCRATEDETWEPSSEGWGNWGMGGPTACLTLNGAECHNGAVVSSLSDVLETSDVPQKYYLSAKACRGILRRAERRGRELPTVLRLELVQVAKSIDLGEGEKTIAT